MKKYIYIIFIISIVISCKPKKEQLDVPYFSFEFKVTDQKESIYNSIDSIFEKPEFIVLNDSSYTFGRIDLIKIINNHIYILDEKNKILLVYDTQGNSIGKVGRFGNGPNEYLDIASFDVDNSGNIYTIDGRLDKLSVYDKQLNYLTSHKLPFEVDQIQILDNGNFMFALSSWNQGLYKNDKIIITDNNLNKIKSYFKYDEYIDNNYWISGYQFIRTEEHIIYNRPIDNNIYIFTREGLLCEINTVNFGRNNVPQEKKKDIEKNLIYYDEYSLLKNFTVITKKFTLGSVWEKTNTKIFIRNNKTGQIYTGNKTDDSDNSLLTGFIDNLIISYIHPDFYLDSPDLKYTNQDIIKQLKNGKIVLCIRRIK